MDYTSDTFGLRARASLASEIAGIDKQKINEAGFHGYVPCLPETKAGSARVFTLFDLVALRVYATMLKAEVSPAVAGLVACKVLELQKQDFHNETSTLEWVTIFPGSPMQFECNPGYLPFESSVFDNLTSTQNQFHTFGFHIHVGVQQALVASALIAAQKVLGED